jgi:hypothetical protein
MLPNGSNSTAAVTMGILDFGIVPISVQASRLRKPAVGMQRSYWEVLAIAVK